MKKILLLAIVLCASSGLTWAAVTACGSTANHSANLGNTGSGLTGSAAAANTPTQGCGTADMGFNNFTVNAQVGTADIAGPTSGNIDPTTSGGTLGGGNLSISPISLNFAVAAGWTTGAHLGAHTVDETISFTETPNLDPAFAPPSPRQWEVFGVSALAIGGTTFSSAGGGGGIPTVAAGTAASIVITETVCLGATTSAGCSASDSATLTVTETYTGNGTNNVFSTVTSSSCTGVSASFGCAASSGGITFNGLQNVFVTDSIVLNHPASTNGNQYTITLLNFTDPFDQEISPEPSTFILLGTALAGIGALRFRKRK